MIRKGHFQTFKILSCFHMKHITYSTQNTLYPYNFTIAF